MLFPSQTKRGDSLCFFLFGKQHQNCRPARQPSQKVKEHIPREKSLKSYPAILIGRLGVSAQFSEQGAGSQLIDAVKNFCLIRFPDFVHFLLVDAYNEPAVLGFYRKNDFMPVFSTEEQEKETYRQPSAEPLRTRYMFYDMMTWRNKIMP